MKSNLKILTLYLDPQIVKIFDVIAKSEQHSRSSLLRVLISNKVEEVNSNKKTEKNQEI